MAVHALRAIGDRAPVKAGRGAGFAVLAPPRAGSGCADRLQPPAGASTPCRCRSSRRHHHRCTRPNVMQLRNRKLRVKSTEAQRRSWLTKRSRIVRRRVSRSSDGSRRSTWLLTSGKRSRSPPRGRPPGQTAPLEKLEQPVRASAIRADQRRRGYPNIFSEVLQSSAHGRSAGGGGSGARAGVPRRRGDARITGSR